MDHIGSHASKRIPGYSAEEYIRESITKPDAYIAGVADGLERDYPSGLMQRFLSQYRSLSAGEIDALVKFLHNQR